MEEEKNYLYKVCRVIYSFLLKFLFRPKIYGTQNIPKDGALIFVGNHRHALDPIVVMSSTNRIVHYMAKEELFKGLHGILFEKIGLIKIYRNKSNPLAILQSEKILNAGGSIGIFPEGTRNRTENELYIYYGEKMSKFKMIPLLLKLKNGKHEGKRRIHKFRTNHVEIDFDEEITFNVDGEKLNAHHFVIDVVPKAITIYNDDEFVQSIMEEN